MSYRIFAKAAVVCAALSSSIAFASTIEVSQPAVRATPPGAPTSGAYLTLANHSETARHLVGVESDAADTVEIHISEMKGDTMKMYQVDDIIVPAHGTVSLRPGSYHIMMIGLPKPLNAGDAVDLTLLMKDGERIDVQAPVLGPEDMAHYAPMAHGAGMSHDHSMGHDNDAHADMDKGSEHHH